MARVQQVTPGGHLVLGFGRGAAVFRSDEFAFKKFDADGRAEQAVNKLRESDGDPRELGLGRSVVPLDRLKSISLIPGYAIVIVRWKGGIEPKSVHLRAQDGVLIEDFYDAVRSKYGDALAEKSCRAAVTDVPADPQLAGVAIFWLLGLACVIGGAFTRGQVGGRQNVFRLLGIVGQWLGPIPSLILGGVLLLGGGALLFRWLRDRPDKTVLTLAAGKRVFGS